MVETNVEMEDTGKLLIDEVMSVQENVGNSELAVEEAGDEQEKLSNVVVNEDLKNQNEIGVEEEKLSENAEEETKLSKNAEEETHVNQSEQELPVNETHGSEKDAASMDDDDKTHDMEKDVAPMDDDKTNDMEKDAASMDDDKTNDMEKDASSMDGDAFMKMEEDKNVGDDAGDEKHQELATPINTRVIPSANKAMDHTVEMLKNEVEDTMVDEGYESGSADDQEAFMKELETFCKEKNLEFKPPKFYGQPLNCLKLWRSVIKLGGYDRVTGLKLWRQVGESFHPPKTCTTVSWTFRIFYEKALLEYERHKMHNGELELPLATVLPEAATIENEANGYQTPGSGRARRDAAARAMQGWHDQRLFGHGEDKNVNGSQKREKSLKSIGSLKQKRPSEVEHPVKAARTETSRHMVPTVADVGPPADWVKVNVQETKDSFEVYALVPGLLREEVRVQSDPAGRLVITGQPEQPDNPWGITAFKKVITLPSRIDPLHTSAIVSLHGRLHVRVPFEQSNI